MRISDWSSDVCSSDLTLVIPGAAFTEEYTRFDVFLEVSTIDGRNATAAVELHTSANIDLQLSVIDSAPTDATGNKPWSVSTPSSDQIGRTSGLGRVWQYV